MLMDAWLPISMKVTLCFFFLIIISVLCNGLDSNDCKDGVVIEQVHLSLLDEYTVHVMWNSSDTIPANVYYAIGKCSSTVSWQKATGTYKIYKHGGLLYSVSLEELEEDSSYCYFIGEPKCGYFKSEFNTPNSLGATVATLSDAGTWGNVTQVMSNLASDHTIQMVVHPGDLSYGLTEPVWDTFGRIVEPVASTKPYMILPGNWDVKPGGIQAFLQRYTMPLVTPLPEEIPTALPINYFYSFNYSVFHFVMLSSYDDFNASSAQYKWLESDLRRANTDRKRRPWVVVSFHRPMYTSNEGHQGPFEPFRLAIEPLLLRYHVDLVLTGDDHGYERSYPVKDNKVEGTKESLVLYHAPGAPIHILVGTAGASQDNWMARPDWSAVRGTSYGYTCLQADHHALHVVFRSIDDSLADEFTITKGRTLNLGYVAAVVMVCIFSVLPLLLYKGLPTSVRNYLLCRDDDDMPSLYRWI